MIFIINQGGGGAFEEKWVGAGSDGRGIGVAGIWILGGGTRKK